VAAQTLEVDVVATLLLAAGKCFGEQRQQWGRVLRWFEGVAVRSGESSFGFVVAMLSGEQKQAMATVLESVERGACNSDGDDGSRDLEVSRVNAVRALYGIS
jgi:hypothetical protein